MKTLKIFSVIMLLFVITNLNVNSQTRISISTVLPGYTNLGNNTPNNAYDLTSGNPNLSTYWSPATNSNSEYIIFDLGATNTNKLTQIVLNFTSQYPYSGILSASTNNTTQWDVLQGNITGTSMTINLAGTQLYRYIKLTNLNVYGSSSPVQLTDISVYYFPNYSSNDITVNRNLNANNITTTGNQIILQTGLGKLSLAGNTTYFNLSTDKSYLLVSSPVTFSNTITTSNITSTGDCSVQGTNYSTATPGIITAGKAYLSGSYAFGGNVSIAGGISQKGGSGATIVLSGATCDGTYPFGGNITLTPGAGYTNGGIILNGSTSISGNLAITSNLTTTGNVGIGCSPTTINLRVYGTTNPLIEVSSPDGTGLQLGKATCAGCFATNGGLAGDAVIRNLGNSNLLLYMPNNNNDDNSYIGFGDDANGIWMKVLNDKKVRINGTVYATEVDVKTNVWSDYVFKPGYKLTSIAETEAYIKANGHLEGVPAEAQVKDKGINVAEMNAILLKKIEEITLLMIEQNKRIEKLEKENSDLKDK
jgi:F5/8 type C domain